MSKEKVLLVDDVALFLELEKTFFNPDLFDVFVARSGLEAVRMASRLSPTIIFMDLHMADMNGDEACAVIKNDPEMKHIPIIMVTHPDEDDVKKCKKCGCDGYVFKPVVREDFLNTANRLIETKQRITSRFGIRLEVHYGSERGERVLGQFAVNMGAGGVFLETEDILAENTPLRLDFTLPGQDKTVSCRGRVAWVNLPGCKSDPELAVGMGIQFVDLQREELHAIREYLQILSRDKGVPMPSLKESCSLSFS